MKPNTREERFSVVRRLQEDLFQEKGSEWMKVISGSMCPLIEVNDRVLVKKIPGDHVRSGDIVLFRSDEFFIVHRVIKILREADSIVILQKGDANNHMSAVRPASIVGKITAIEKKGKIVELESLRGKCMNVLPAIRNYFSYRDLIYSEQGNCQGEHGRFSSHRGWLDRYASKSLAICNRMVVKVLFPVWLNLFLVAEMYRRHLEGIIPTY